MSRSEVPVLQVLRGYPALVSELLRHQSYQGFRTLTLQEGLARTNVHAPLTTG